MEKNKDLKEELRFTWGHLYFQNEDGEFCKIVNEIDDLIDFISQELDKAREEGREFAKRFILNTLNTRIENSEVFVKTKEGTEEVTDQVQDILRMFTRRVMKDFDKLNSEGK